MIKALQASTLLLAAAVLFSGCAKKAEPASVDAVSIRETVITADPQAAIDEIYATLPDARTEPLTGDRFDSLFSDLEEEAASYCGRVSDASGGLADVFIIEPVGGESKANRDAVRDALRRYQDKRMQEFENYDILDSFAIATEAEVFDQGDYVILLMLPDREAAREIIDRHIPL